MVVAASYPGNMLDRTSTILMMALTPGLTGVL
jgi:hypothetical protein